MNNVIIKEFVGNISDLARIKLVELIQKGKVSTDFLNRLIEMYSKSPKLWIKYSIDKVLSDLEEGLDEEKILWLYSYENDFNQYYSKIIEKSEDFWSVNQAEAILPKFYTIMKDAFNSGATIEQVKVVAKPFIPLNHMKSFLIYLKLGIGLNIDFSEMHYGNKLNELNKETTEKLEQILLNL